MIFFLIRTLYYLVRVYSMILVAYALLSWFPGAYQTSLGQFVIRLAEPVLRPFKRMNLVFGGIDWSVFVAMIALNMASELIVRLLVAFL